MKSILHVKNAQARVRVDRPVKIHLIWMQDGVAIPELLTRKAMCGQEAPHPAWTQDDGPSNYEDVCGSCQRIFQTEFRFDAKLRQAFPKRAAR
jgi:hypothetical protein